MAHILKHPSRDTKGIIIFTHQETNWFFPLTKSIKSLLRNLKSGGRPDEKIYNKIRKNYFIGLHVGADPKKINLDVDCDFYLTTNDSKPVNTKILQIPLTARNFTPEYFTKQNYNKYWDILNISSIHKDKKLDLFLKSIKKIFDLGYDYKVLLITREHKTKLPHFYNSLMDDYYSLFSSKERNNFVILQLSPQTQFPGLSQGALPFFFNSSKVCTLFTQVEGGSKTISEALCCGVPMVVKNDLFGGGRDFLNETNSLFFDTYENAHEALIYAVKNYDKFKTNPELSQEYVGEKQSIKKLYEYFNTLYQQHGQKFDGELINMDKIHLRICGHYYENSPWAQDRNIRAHITSNKQLDIFLKELVTDTIQSK